MQMLGSHSINFVVNQMQILWFLGKTPSIGNCNLFGFFLNAALLLLWFIRIAQLFHQYAFVVNRIFVAVSCIFKWFVGFHRRLCESQKESGEGVRANVCEFPWESLASVTPSKCVFQGNSNCINILKLIWQGK